MSGEGMISITIYEHKHLSTRLKNAEEIAKRRGKRIEELESRLRDRSNALNHAIDYGKRVDRRIEELAARLAGEHGMRQMAIVDLTKQEAKIKELEKSPTMREWDSLHNEILDLKAKLEKIGGLPIYDKYMRRVLYGRSSKDATTGEASCNFVKQSELQAILTPPPENNHD